MSAGRSSGRHAPPQARTAANLPGQIAVAILAALALGAEWLMVIAGGAPTPDLVTAAVCHGVAVLLTALVATLRHGELRGRSIAGLAAGLALLAPPAGVPCALMLVAAVRRRRGSERGVLDALEHELHAKPRVLSPRRAPTDRNEAVRERVDVEPIVDALRFGDLALKRGAIQRLQEAGGRGAVRALRVALADLDAEVRSLALEALAAIEDRLSRAVLAAQEEVRRRPLDPEAHAALGRQYMEYCFPGFLDPDTRGHYLEQAVQAYGQALAHGAPRAPDLLRSLGIALLHLDHPRRALGFFDRAVREDRTDPRSILWRAEALYRLDQLEVCRADCERALAILGDQALERGDPLALAATYWQEVRPGEAGEGVKPETGRHRAVLRGFETPTGGLAEILLDPDRQELAQLPTGEELASLVGLAVADLESASGRTRQAAYQRLLLVRTDEAAALVTRHLREVGEAARMLLCRFLGHVGSEQATGSLLELLDEESEVVAREAAATLDRLPPERLEEPLLRALEGTSPRATLYACEGLSRAGVTRAVHAIGRLAVKSPSPPIRRAGVRALRRLRDPRALAALASAARDRDAETRFLAVHALGELGPLADRPLGPARAASLAAARDPSAKVRQAAAWSLGRLGGRRARASLSRLLRDDPSGAVRIEAARRLGRVGHKTSVGPLTRAYAYDPEAAVRLQSSFALDCLPRPLVRRGLIRLLEATDVKLRYAACVKLGDVGGGRTRVPLERTLAGDQAAAARAAAATALGRLGTPASARALETALTDENEAVAYAAALALASLLAAAGLDGLAQRVEEVPGLAALPPQAMLGLLRAIYRAQGTRALPDTLVRLALRALESPSLNVRYEGAAVLGRSRVPEALARLVQLAAEDPEPTVVEQSLDAAAQLARGEVRGLLALLTDKDTDTPRRRAAVETVLRTIDRHGLGPRTLNQLADALAAPNQSGITPGEVEALARRAGARGDLLVVTAGFGSVARRQAAARLLESAARQGELAANPARAEPLLFAALPAVRRAGALALGALGALRAVDRLVRLSRGDPAADVQCAAREALRLLINVREVHTSAKERAA